ncbi:MAG: molybdopterin-dependent oxidoreductase, partial [Phycisphaerae bacterium]
VAQDHGIEIPSYCYHPGLSIVASCRICLVEIESPDPKDPSKLVKLPKLTPSCQTPAVDGMKVYTKSEKSVANQKAVMEFLLLNHPLDCPVCDQAGECGLQDYSYKYGRAISRLEEDKSKNPKKDVGQNILLYSDRCILCTRCVRFTREVSGTAELGVFGRGHKEEIDVFPGRPVNNPLAGNVVDICPVGALLDKDFLFTQRVWFLRSAPSISPINSGGENINIDHNQGRIYRLKPRFNAAVNKWWIADETRYGWKFVHENRLTTPERLQYGSNTETSWQRAYAQTDEDLRTIVKEKGPGSLAAVLSPFDATEEMFLQAKYIRSIDPQAWLILNPPKIAGEDHIFKNPQTKAVTYTIKAEKAPNRVGGEKILAHFGGNTCDLTTLAAHLKAKKVLGLLVSVDMINHNDEDHKKLLVGATTLVTLATRKGGLYEKANISLPACTWAEKDGVYENFAGLIQPFTQAIAPLEDTRSAGRIFWDLLGTPGTYSAAAARHQMAAAGLSGYAEIQPPAQTIRLDTMQFAEL